MYKYDLHISVQKLTWVREFSLYQEDHNISNIITELICFSHGERTSFLTHHAGILLSHPRVGYL